MAVDSVTPALGAPAVAAMEALTASSSIRYDFGADAADVDGNLIADLTPYLVKAPSTQVPEVKHDSTADSSGALAITIDEAPSGRIPISPVWGRDLILPYLLVGSDTYDDGRWQRFPLGLYVMTSPNIDLRANSAHAVIGFDKIYLLQNDVGDTYTATTGTTYTHHFATLLAAAGFPSALVSGELNPLYVNFPGSLTSKTLPADRVFPADEGNTFNFIAIINALLKECGCRPLWCGQTGQFTIEYLPHPGLEPHRWVFSGGATEFDSTFPASSKVIEENRNFTSDVWNIPNRWVFVQRGRSFEPTEGDGQYTVDNAIGQPSYMPPSDQNTVGRIIRKTIYLDASDQGDLQAQGDALVVSQFSQAEKITLDTAPWPCAWHYDVFQYADSTLDSGVRKVQAQNWSLPLTGEPMSWSTLVVASA